MLSAADFKKQVSKTLAGHLKTLGFKGSGFNYLLDTDNFVFTIGIQASRYGGQCCAELGIQPKEIDRFGDHTIDFGKLKYFNCAFRTRLSNKNGSEQWWKYSDHEQQNIEIANEIFETVQKDVVPIIDRFRSSPYVLDSIEVDDLENNYKSISGKLEGMKLMNGNILLAWALTKVYEKRDVHRAKQFANFGLSKLGSDSDFIGKTDFKRILKLT